MRLQHKTLVISITWFDVICVCSIKETDHCKALENWLRSLLAYEHELKWVWLLKLSVRQIKDIWLVDSRADLSHNCTWLRIIRALWNTGSSPLTGHCVFVCAHAVLWEQSSGALLSLSHYYIHLKTASLALTSVQQHTGGSYFKCNLHQINAAASLEVTVISETT